MTSMTYLQAIHAAQAQEMERDERVLVMGEDVRDSVFGTTDGFVERFGPDRIRNTPISENAIVGVAAGAAMTGLRPIVDLTIASFAYLAMDQFVNQVAKNRLMSGGQAVLPVVYRAVMFYGASNAAHHSDRPYPMFMGVPGLRIAAPTTPADVKGVLAWAIRSDDPVVIFEDANLWNQRGEVPEGEHLVEIGTARVERPGSDVTIAAVAGGILAARDAADRLSTEGVSAEVVDVRSLAPLDTRTICTSAARTGRLVVVDPAHRTCSAASEIAAVAQEECWGDLLGPVGRVTTPDLQVPFSPSLEDGLYPTAAAVVDAVHALTGLAPSGAAR